MLLAVCLLIPLVASDAFAAKGPGRNRAPVVNNQSFSDSENSPADKVVGTVGASDPGGDTLSYSTSAGCMFLFKLHEFLRTVKRDELVGFAHDPILIYAFVAIGFLCLLAWAFLTGQFRDIEGTKYEMLERIERQERAERALLGGPQEYRE